MNDNILDNGTVVEQYKSGVVKKFVLDNGYEFEAYVPNNYSSSTPVTIYEHGDGGYYNDWTSYKQKFSTDDCNSIIIRADRNNSMALYNHIVEQYNLNPSKNMTVSFSGGTVYALQETAQMIQQNPNNSPIAVILDGYVPTSYLKSAGVVDKLIEGDAIVLGFAQLNGDNCYVEQYKALAATGVNVVILKDKSAYGTSHGNVNLSYMEGGILEFSLGEGELPDRYEILVYDSASGQFVSLDHSQVSTLNSIYQYFGVDRLQVIKSSLSSLKDYSITSDNKVLMSYLNPIVGLIRNSNFLTADIGISSSCTTQVPSAIPECLQRYFLNVSNTLEGISSLMNTIASIDTTYQKVDQSLSNSYNNSFLENIYTGVSNTVDKISDVVEDFF